MCVLLFCLGSRRGGRVMDIYCYSSILHQTVTFSHLYTHTHIRTYTAQLPSTPLHILSITYTHTHTHTYTNTAQLPSTPLHILSMDLYARQNATWGSRMAEVAKGYKSVTTGRIMRIIPAFGMGGFINDVRTHTHTYTHSHMHKYVSV
jgi:hypothetical protein